MKSMKNLKGDKSFGMKERMLRKACDSFSKLSVYSNGCRIMPLYEAELPCELIIEAIAKYEQEER